MPTIEYQLSFEHYLEMTSSRREKKDYRFAAFSAITGFFCIAGGYLFLKLGHESFFPGGFLLATGLLGMLLGFLAKSKPTRPDTKTLQREYELACEDRRTLEFDDKGWKVQWQEGEDFRPWSCLRQIYDLETLLVLATGTTYYWFPKEALQEAGQLEPLKAIAESSLAKRQMLFQVALRPSALVYVAGRMYHGWLRLSVPRLLGLSAVVLIIYWGLLGQNETLSGKAWGLVAVPLLLTLLEALFYFASYYKEDWSAHSTNAEIMSDCTGFRSKKVRWIIEHRQLMNLREIPGAFLLYFEPNSYYLFPKRSFSKEQMTRFREVITTTPLQAATR